MLKSLLVSTFILAFLHLELSAQEIQYTKPSWYFGVAGAANLNYHDGNIQRLNSGFATPAAFSDGQGIGVYAAPLVEFHRPESMLGFMLQAGYDGRRGDFDEMIPGCNCPAELLSNFSYITVEPSLKFAPFKKGFYVYAGPRLAFNLDKRFVYKQGTDPNLPNQEEPLDVFQDFDNVNDILISMQVGAGYDISLSSSSHRTQFVFSPFVAYHPTFGQETRSVESWDLSTLRVGAALKFGCGQPIVVPASNTMVDYKAPKVSFSVYSPKNIPTERKVSETFPLRNYVFFNEGSTEIPERYVTLRKNEVKDFKEDQLENLKPKKASGRSEREMVVYYNVLNILGDRLGKNPTSSITLVGSSENGTEEGKIMAGSIKKYLTDVFNIDASRISIEGRDKPKLPSGQSGGTRELELLLEGNRRVSIESNSPELLMEFQSGANAPLKPVMIKGLQEAPPDSYVSFHADGAKDAFSSWKVEIRDDKGKFQSFGPYTSDKVIIPGKSILGTQPNGDFKVTMIGMGKDGKVMRKDTTVRMVLWKPALNEEGMRYSVLYEFDDSKSSSIYEKYLAEVVTPQIPQGATVIIHGYTDIIGEMAYNETLSMARAKDVRNILEKSVSKAGRNDVKFQVYGYGEDEILAPFDNNYPEERFYNRTVIVDIIPKN